MCRRRAFTLVELLVVIGIIALLIAILLPVLNKAKEAANKIACASNLRSIGQALYMYTNETKYYPAHAAQTSGGITAVWPSRLRKYAKMGRKVFWCPSRDTGYQWQDKTGTGAGFATSADAGYGYDPGEVLLLVSTIRFSYGYNDWGAGALTSNNNEQKGLGGDINFNYAVHELKASRVRKPAEMLAIADVTGSADWKFNLDPYQSDQFPAKIHNLGANVLFADGHVQWYLQKSLLVVSGPTHDIVARMWNNDNKP